MPAAPAWHASPSALNGVAMQFDEIGERMSASAAPAVVSSLKALPSKCPTNVFSVPLTFSIHDT